MDADDARTLIAPAVTEPGGIWADIGSGEDTFTGALAELLGPDARIYAVDRDERALARLESRAGRCRIRCLFLEPPDAGPTAIPAPAPTDRSASSTRIGLRLFAHDDSQGRGVPVRGISARSSMSSGVPKSASTSQKQDQRGVSVIPSRARELP